MRVPRHIIFKFLKTWSELTDSRVPSLVLGRWFPVDRNSTSFVSVAK